MLTRLRGITMGRLLMIGSTAAVVIALAIFVIVGKPVTQVDAISKLPAPLAAGDPVQRSTPGGLTLIDEQGKQTSLKALRGKWVIFAPAMTLCHETCPMTTGALNSIAQQVHAAGLSSQVTIAEISVDPWRDTPARLRAYKKKFGANFAMYTGTLPQLKRFWKFFGVYFRKTGPDKPVPIDWMTGKPETMDVEHTDGLFFLDPAGHERIVVLGEPDVEGHLSKALRSLLDKEGREDLAKPKLPWTADEAMDDLDWLMGREVPAASVAKVKPPTRVKAQKELVGSPSPLSAIHDQAGELLGSTAALKARISDLKGYPIVVNAWASWCPPCRDEFPLFATASATFGRKVAFLGVDTEDEAASAQAFLDNHPVSYPSYQSSTSGLSSLGPIDGVPTTFFIGTDGKVLFVHAGQYETEATLDQDIERYALNEST